MKRIDIFCASQASTAICLSMEEPSSSSSSASNTLLLRSSPAIDRYNPIIRDSSRTPSKPITPPTKPHYANHNDKKKNNKKFPPKENVDQSKKNDTKPFGDVITIKPDDDEKIKISSRSSIGRKSWSGCIKPGDVTTIKPGDEDEKTKISSHNSLGRKSWSCTRPDDVISPPGSTRYLLREKVVFNSLSDLDPTLKLFPDETSKAKALKTNELSCDAKELSLPSQVVVLRVSLHCRGCEKKMRKHLSRMEGVTSFIIDFLAKKVTVTGNITPLDVLSSISKVKNAQLWPPTISSSAATVDLSNSSEFKTDQQKGGGA